MKTPHSHEQLSKLDSPESKRSAVHSEIVEAFIRLHTSWLGATHRRDMNKDMDALAQILGLDPLTLQPLNAEVSHGSAEKKL